MQRHLRKVVHWLSQIPLMPPAAGAGSAFGQPAAATPAELATLRAAFPANGLRVISKHPLILGAKEFLSLDECAAIINGARADGVPIKGSSGANPADTKYELDTWPMFGNPNTDATDDDGGGNGGGGGSGVTQPTALPGAAQPPQLCYKAVLESAYSRIDGIFNCARRRDEVVPKVHFASSTPPTAPSSAGNVCNRVSTTTSSSSSGGGGGSDGRGSNERMPLGLHVDTNAVGTYGTAILYLTTLPPGGDGATVFPCAVPTAGQVGDDVRKRKDDGSFALPDTVAAAEKLLADSVLHTESTAGDVAAEKQARVLLNEASDEQNGISIYPEAGKLVVFFTRMDDGTIDPCSWHGGAAVVGGTAGPKQSGGIAGVNNSTRAQYSHEDKWMIQLCKEVPLPLRGEQAQATFVAARRRDALAVATCY